MQCTKCGATLQPGMTTCPTCGTPVATDAPDDSSPYEGISEAVPYIPYTPAAEAEGRPSPAMPSGQQVTQGSEAQVHAAASGSSAQNRGEIQSTVYPGYRQPFSTQQGLPSQSLAGAREIHPPPVAQPVQQRRGLSARAVVLLIILIFLILGSGAGILYYATGPYPAELHAQATVVVQNLLAGQAQATAEIANLPPQELYARITSTKPDIQDPLNSANHSIWITTTSSGFSCGFSGPNYHARVSANHFYPCFSAGVNLSNLAFQVQMTIIAGDAGGLLFHLDPSNGRGYLFIIDHSGNYNLLAFNGALRRLVAGTSPVIKQGLNQQNLLTAIARNNVFYLYINQQYITRVSDSSFTSGLVGLTAIGVQNATEVAFSNAQVWRL